MGFEPVAKALVLSMLLTSFIFNAVFAAEEDIVAEYHHGGYGPAVSPSPSPSHHHHHHHHHNKSHPPSHPPVHPPSKPPSHPPVKPPVKPPSHPPVKPPSHPPMKPPSHPPVKPPSHPPVKPPSHPPVKPPSHPPVKPPSHPPVKGPSKPPVKAPSHPPVKAPSKPPVKAPSHPPVKPPSHPPVKPPSYPPVKPPTKPPTPLPPRKLVAVQGVVYCKPCKYTGIETLLFASPLAGAEVKLECKNTRYPLRIKATTDKNGYFLIRPKTITTYAAHKCKVTLLKSPSKRCSLATDFHGGLSGAPLKLEKSSVSKPLPFVLYTVGPFAFEPNKTVQCP